MPDQKYSGLPAVAAALTTHEWGVNESGVSKKINVGQIIAVVAQGTLTGGYAVVTANQTGISAITDLTGLTVTVTPGTSRRIRVTGYGYFLQNTSTGTIILTIREGATVLASGVLSLAATFSSTITASAILTPTSAAHTYKLSLQTNAGTVDLNASATIPAYILVEDVGV